MVTELYTVVQYESRTGAKLVLSKGRILEFRFTTRKVSWADNSKGARQTSTTEQLEWILSLNGHLDRLLSLEVFAL